MGSGSWASSSLCMRQSIAALCNIRGHDEDRSCFSARCSRSQLWLTCPPSIWRTADARFAATPAATTTPTRTASHTVIARKKLPAPHPARRAATLRPSSTTAAIRSQPISPVPVPLNDPFIGEHVQHSLTLGYRKVKQSCRLSQGGRESTHFHKLASDSVDYRRVDTLISVWRCRIVRSGGMVQQSGAQGHIDLPMQKIALPALHDAMRLQRQPVDGGCLSKLQRRRGRQRVVAREAWRLH